jgi:hypothetical protein
MRAASSIITTYSYYNSAFYYSRTMAVSGRRRMLFSSGDSLRTLSSILSGEGFNEREQRESPLTLSDCSGFQPTQTYNRRFHSSSCHTSGTVIHPTSISSHGQYNNLRISTRRFCYLDRQISPIFKCYSEPISLHWSKRRQLEAFEQILMPPAKTNTLTAGC